MPTSNPQTASTGTASRSTASRLSWPAALLALACTAAGSALALHYPLSASSALLLFVLVTAFAWLRPQAWLVLLPALLPIVGFAPWSGWITFEELDLIVLAVAAGCYARLAWRGTSADTARATAAPNGRRGTSVLVWLALALFAASLLISMARGFADAGGFVFGWFQGYREPMNSLRLAKPFFAALLLLPLWALDRGDTPEKAGQGLSLGMTLGLLGVSLGALWERLAFTDLLNFSSDYRTTSLFWEMHVGGAALDGFLALGVPFAVREMMVATSKARWLLAAAVASLAAYAAITTFSRGVYLALPVGLAVMVVLHSARQRRRSQDTAQPARHAMALRVALVATFGLAAAWMFPTSGYRGLLALFGTLVVLLPLAAALHAAHRRERTAGLCLGLVLSLLAVGLAWLLDKGAYIAYALGVVFAAGALIWNHRTRREGATGAAASMALAGYLWALTGIGLVSLHWGGVNALWHALPVIVLLLAAALAASGRSRPAWPDDLRWQGNTLGLAVVAGGLLAVFGGGAYMGERFSSTGTDLSGRTQHWSLSLSILGGPEDWLLGKGLGRYPETYAIAAPENMRPGDYRLRLGDNGFHLVLTGGAEIKTDERARALGGDMLRLSQRVGVPRGPVQLDMKVRADVPTKLVAGVCAKHLLYSDNCIGREVSVKADPGRWQQLQLPLRGHLPSRGMWYAPRLLFFTIGIDNPGGQVEIDDLSLRDAAGNSLLANGDFGDELAHWFFTSDRSHLPWHAKNMGLQLLFDQGLVGLVLLGTLLVAALWRLAWGTAKQHALAPALAGALTGFAVVGLFDSLIDVPRVTFVFYSLLLIALTLRGAPAASPAGAARDLQRSRSAPADS